jgi:hypothetical protein
MVDPNGLYTPARRRDAALRHGHAGSERGAARRSPTYYSWQNMLARCRYPSVPSFPNYGGKGITVCTRWLSFASFLADMGERPAGMQIGRIDHKGNYEPGNTVWTPRAENVAESNRRRVTRR